jgi:hypothetical protein
MGALDERGRNSARFEVSGSFVVEMLLGGDFEAQMLHGRCRPWAHGCRLSSRPRRVRVLRSPSSLLEAERRKKKSAAAARLGDAQSDVAAAHDVEGRIEGVLGKRASAWTPKDQGLTGQAAAAVWRAMVGPHTHCGRGS